MVEQYEGGTGVVRVPSEAVQGTAAGIPQDGSVPRIRLFSDDALRKANVEQCWKLPMEREIQGQQSVKRLVVIRTIRRWNAKCSFS